MSLFNSDSPSNSSDVPSRSQDLGLANSEMEQAKVAIRRLCLPGGGGESVKELALRNFDVLSAGKYGPLNKLILISSGIAGVIGGFDPVVDAQSPELKVFHACLKTRIEQMRARMTEREKLESLVVPSLGD